MVGDRKAFNVSGCVSASSLIAVATAGRPTWRTIFSSVNGEMIDRGGMSPAVQCPRGGTSTGRHNPVAA